MNTEWVLNIVKTVYESQEDSPTISPESLAEAAMKVAIPNKGTMTIEQFVHYRNAFKAFQHFSMHFLNQKRNRHYGSYSSMRRQEDTAVILESLAGISSQGL